MNKTIADAYEALDGDLKNSFLFRRSDKFLTYNTYNTKNVRYICLDYVNDREYEEYGHQYICTVEEFNNYKPESKMIKFDLEKALAGEKVMTRDGRPITQLVEFKTYSGSVLYGFDCDNDHVEQWLINGDYHDTKGECGGDLFMAPKKLSGYIAIFHNGQTSGVCRTEERARGAYAKSVTEVIDLSQFEEGHGL